MGIYFSRVLHLLEKGHPEYNTMKHRASQCMTVDNKICTVSNVIRHRSVPLQKGQWWNLRLFSEVEEVDEKNVIS